MSSQKGFHYDLDVDINICCTFALYIEELILFENIQIYKALCVLNEKQKDIFNNVLLQKKVEPRKQFALFIIGGARAGKICTMLLIAL